MPPALSDAEKRAWRYVVPLLEGAGLLRSCDSFALEALCLIVARLRQARKELNAQLRKDKTLYIRGSTHNLVEHPALQTERLAVKELARWCDRFGLDPASRVKLGDGGLAGRAAEADIQSAIGPPPRLRSIEGGRGN
jgi:P27 family predicted phage terminase small subunit